MMYQGKYWRIARKAMQKAFPFMPALKYDYPKVMKHFFSPEDNWDNVFPTLSHSGTVHQEPVSMKAYT